MLSTELSTVAVICALTVAAFCLILAITCWLNARSARLYAANCEIWVQKVAKMRDPTAPIAELTAEMTDLTDSFQSLLRSHKKLRARIGMREARAKKRDMDAETDLGSETDKRALRLAAKQSGLLK